MKVRVGTEITLKVKMKKKKKKRHTGSEMNKGYVTKSLQVKKRYGYMLKSNIYIYTERESLIIPTPRMKQICVANLP